MAENNTSAEYNCDENSDCEGHKNEYVGDNESIAQDSVLDSSDIEVSSFGYSEVSSDHTDFGDEWDTNRPYNVNDTTIIANANILNWTTNFNDITIELLLRKVSLLFTSLLFT